MKASSLRMLLILQTLSQTLGPDLVDYTKHCVSFQDLFFLYNNIILFVLFVNIYKLSALMQNCQQKTVKLKKCSSILKNRVYIWQIPFSLLDSLLGQSTATWSRRCGRSCSGKIYLTQWLVALKIYIEFQIVTQCFANLNMGWCTPVSNYINYLIE